MQEISGDNQWVVTEFYMASPRVSGLNPTFRVSGQLAIDGDEF